MQKYNGPPRDKSQESDASSCSSESSASSASVAQIHFSPFFAHWANMHVTAIMFPEFPSEQQKSAAIAHYSSIGFLLPCVRPCGEHYYMNLEKYPLDVSSGLALHKWVCRVHNEVNCRTGKRTWTEPEAREFWSAMFNLSVAHEQCPDSDAYCAFGNSYKNEHATYDEEQGVCIHENYECEHGQSDCNKSDCSKSDHSDDSDCKESVHKNAHKKDHKKDHTKHHQKNKECEKVNHYEGKHHQEKHQKKHREEKHCEDDHHQSGDHKVGVHNNKTNTTQKQGKFKTQKSTTVTMGGIGGVKFAKPNGTACGSNMNPYVPKVSKVKRECYE